MRIRLTTWLAATASLAGVAWGTSNQVIFFQDADFVTTNTTFPNIAILTPADLEPIIFKRLTKNFTWQSRGVLVNQVSLWGHDKVLMSAKLTLASNDAPDPSHTTSSTMTFPSSSSRPLREREHEGKMTLTADADSGTVFVDATELLAMAAEIGSSAVYFQADWANGAGSSYSRNFTVITADPGPGTFESLAKTFSDSSPAIAETAVTTAATSPTPTASDAGQLPSTSTAAPANASSNGLSTGAIAGIAVGCGIVGLAIIAGALWFCCRRRRQEGMAGYGEARNRTQELMAEKEANGGADVAPHSPYSDDGTGGLTGNGHHHHSDGLMAGGAAGVGLATADYQHPAPPSAIDRSYTPYSDRPIASVGSPATQRASLGAGRTESAHVSEHDQESHAAPGGIRSATSASQYAHLVEDGMTADEIRRIEEEERQLDAAIEQAGTRR